MKSTDDRKYFIYLTTNNINGMKYVGKHLGYEDDSYLGSGTKLLEAIKEYGKENFSRIILTYSENEDENAQKEKEFIKLFNAVQDPMFYNIHEGGHGGNTTAGWSEEDKIAYSKMCSERLSGPGNPRWGVHLSEETKQKIRENRDISYMYTCGMQIGSLLRYLEMNWTEQDAAKELQNSLNIIQEQNRILSFVSDYDELSQLLNRRGFMEQALACLSRNEGQKAYIVFCDVDHLK